MDKREPKEALAQIQADKQIIIQKWKQEIKKKSDNDYREAVSSQTLEDWLTALIQDIYDSTPDAVDNIAHREASKLAAQGVNEKFFRILLGALSTVLWDYTVNRWSDDPATALALMRQADAHIIRSRTEMAGVFLDKRMDMIAKQQQALMELSTPVIPLLEHILIVPLIGNIDTARANQIMENILYGITERDAEIVIMDITGVHIVDSTVAHHLIKAYQAAKLLGAKCLLVGMRPEVAQTIVQLDISFDYVDTKSTLAQGIEYALQLQGKKIVDTYGSEVKANGKSHTNLGNR